MGFGVEWQSCSCFQQCICLRICPVVDGAANNEELHHETLLSKVR